MKTVCVIMITTLLFLTGCWDQQLLKNTRLIYAAGFDLVDGQYIKDTIVIRSVTKDSKEGKSNEIVSVIGKTVRQSRELLNERISGEFGSSKIQVFLLGSELAKRDIYPFLDVFYRDPVSPLSSKLAVVKGEASQILYLKQKEETLIAEYIGELINSAEESQIIPDHPLQLICTHMFDEGRDFGLPLLKYDQQNKGVKLLGLALFDENTYTGKDLTTDQSRIMMIIAGEKINNAQFTFQVDEKDEESWIYNFVSFKVNKVTNKTTFVINNDDIITSIVDLKIIIDISEYPTDSLHEIKNAEKLISKITEQFNTRIGETIKILQDANTDVFGFGRDLLAYHSNQLPQKKLAPDYFKKMKIETKVKIEITNSGVIF